MTEYNDGVGVPAHQRIREALRQRISSLQPGDPLPSEAALAGEFGVSRMTARQALVKLAQEGLIVRRAGVGNFVAEPQVHRRMGGLLSFTSEMLRKGRIPGSRLLQHQVVEVSSEIAKHLGIPAKAPVLWIRRLRLADGVPMAVETTQLSADRFGDLPVPELEYRSLHETLRERYGVDPTFAQGHLVAAIANPPMARWLELAPGAALLVERRTVFDQRSAPVEWTETCYAGERYVFDVELHKEPEEAE